METGGDSVFDAFSTGTLGEMWYLGVKSRCEKCHTYPMNYLTQKPKSDVYYANLTIPPELRPIIGRGVRFFQSTKTKSHPEALRRANALVTGWKAEISKAKGQLPNAKDDFWESLRRDYIRAKDEGTEFAIQDIAVKESSKVKDPIEASYLYKFATDQVGTLLAPLVED